jgi:hypothetical protein
MLDMKDLIKKVLNENVESKKMVLSEQAFVSENLIYHINEGLSLHENVFRPFSDEFFNLINEVRVLHHQNKIKLSNKDRWLVGTDIGKTGLFEGDEVWLDIPFIDEEEMLNEAEYQGKTVQLNKPKRGGSKKFYVYTRNPKTGKIVKVSFGAKSGGGKLSVKFKDPKRRKAFADRHNCSSKTDKTSPGYWSCRLPRYAEALGLGSNMNTFW